MISAGRNTFGQLLVHSNKQSEDGSCLVNPPLPVSINYADIIDFSVGGQHCAYVTKSGELYAAGDDRTFCIGTKTRQIYQEPFLVTFANISDKFVSVYCGQIYTTYLTEKGIIIICSQNSINHTPAIHKFQNKPIYINGNYLSPVAIDAQGDFYIFSKNPSNAPVHVHLQEPVYDICRCCVFVPNQKNTISNHDHQTSMMAKYSFTAVITVNGKLFANGFLNNGSKSFSEVYSLHGVHMRHLYGYCGHCIAISDDGRAFSIGNNNFGQLGNGTINDKNEFVHIKDINEAIVGADVGGAHSLLITESGKLMGFGSNQRGQLFMSNLDEKITEPIECLLNKKITHVWCGNSSSVALVGEKPPNHRGYAHFFEGKELLSTQLKKISYSNIQNMENQIEKLKKEIEIEKKRSAPNNEIFEENKILKKKMEMKISDIFALNDQLTEENSRKDDDIARLVEEIEWLKKENSDLQIQQLKASDLSQEVQNLRNEINKKDMEISKLVNIIERTKEKPTTIECRIPTYPISPVEDHNQCANSSYGKQRSRPNITRPMITNRK